MAKTIMIVDDSSTILMSMRNSLEIAGYDVVSATDGAIALGKLQSGAKPDLIITDINMPNMEGNRIHRQGARSWRFPVHPDSGADH